MTYRRRVDSDQLDATRANDTRGESNAHVASARAVLRNSTSIISEILRVASRKGLSAFTKAKSLLRDFIVSLNAELLRDIITKTFTAIT